MSNNTWDSTELRDETNTSLTVKDIKQLLIARGANRKKLWGKKSDLIKLLKNNYDPTLSDNKILSLTIEEVQPEYKLWFTDYKDRIPDELVARLINKDTGQWLISAAPNVKLDFAAVKLNLMKINDNEFYTAFTAGNKINYICKYNVAQNNWKSWCIDYSVDDTNIKFCFNDADKLIYVYYEHEQTNGILLKINFETKEIIKVTENLCLIHACADTVFAKHKLHVVGGEHLILDVNKGSNKLEECCGFKRLTNNSERGKLISNGSKNIYYGSSSGQLYSYNSILNAWSSLRMDIPWMSKNSVCVITGDQSYILLFRNRKIHVLNLKNKKWRISKSVCPKRKSFSGYAVITRNSQRAELITFGFVRKCWIEYEIGEHMFPPQYIVKLMQSWVDEEYVHLIYNRYDWNNHQYHWKMNVAHIINHLQ
eukprot:292616_1